MIERTPYHTIKLWYLQSAFEYSQTKFEDGFVLEWQKYESEWAEPEDLFEYSYNTPIEKLMFNVVDIICLSGRSPIGHQYLLNEIHTLLEQHPLDELLQPLGKEEKAEFLQDLNRVLHNSRLSGEQHV